MGTVCNKTIYQNQKDYPYPIIAKLMKFSPHKQCPLEKPFNLSGQVEDAQEINYLETILSNHDIPEKKIEELPKTRQPSQEVIKKQLQHLYEKQTQTQKAISKQEQAIKKQDLDNALNQKLRRSITLNSHQPDECSVRIAQKSQANSDSQTIKSILKTNKSKSHKSAPKVTLQSTGKKVHFEPKVIKPRNRNFFM